MAALERASHTEKEKHAAELKKVNETIEQLHNKLDKAHEESAVLKTQAKTDQQQLTKAEQVIEQSNKQASAAREEEAKLKGKIEAMQKQIETMQAQQAGFMRVLKNAK